MAATPKRSSTSTFNARSSAKNSVRRSLSSTSGSPPSRGSPPGSPTATRRVPRLNSKSKLAVPVDLDSPADYRVYFATNFFRSKGTAVPHFTAENLQKELTLMALAFVADDANVLVDVKRGELQLSNIFTWYRKDFSSSSNLGGACDDSDKDLTQLVFQFLESPKKLSLQQFLYTGNSKKLKLTFHMDDWKTNAAKKDKHPFTPASLDSNSTRF